MSRSRTLYAYGGTHDREVTWVDLNGCRTCTTGEFAVRLSAATTFTYTPNEAS